MKQQIEDHLRVISALRDEVPLLESIADTITECFRGGGRLYILGNGGSAADAQHIAAELMGRFKCDRRPLPAVALTTDTSTLTAVANDLGADVIFARQVEGLATQRDIVWALSVSGRSPNVIAAVDAARRCGARVIGFTGRKGQPLAERSVLCLIADHEDSGRVQETHQLAYHLICERIEKALVAADTEK